MSKSNKVILGQNRDGINASINVQANITPNITIRIEAPNSRTDQNQTDETNNQAGSEPEVVADNTPGLSRDILQQITNSVTRYTIHRIINKLLLLTYFNLKAERDW